MVGMEKHQAGHVPTEGSAAAYAATTLRGILDRVANRAPPVPDIFISYSTQHAELTRSLAAAIEARYGAGSVWWDQAGLRAGDRFSPEITRALDAADAVVVVWTQGSVVSDWVYAEATRAAHQGKLVPVRAADLDPKSIPLPFYSVFHTCFADDTQAVLEAIAKRISGEVPPRGAEPPPG